MAEQRKLRPAMDALVVNNLRQAVKLCAGLEAKNPLWSSPKSLRAVALLRMGRLEEAEALVTSVRAELPLDISARKLITETDQDTLSYLHMFYRESDREAEAGRMYEEAWSEGRHLSEPVGRRAYLAYLRAASYSSAQRVATKLNRSFGRAAPYPPRNDENEPDYPLWAALAVYLGVKLSEDPARDSRMMVLAQAMAKKSVITGGLHSPEAVRFLLRTISDEVSPAGESELSELLSWVTDGGPLTKESNSPGFATEMDRLEVIADVELKLGEVDRASDIFESLLTGMDGDNWRYWQGFFDTVFVSAENKVLCDVDPEILRTRTVIERVVENFNNEGRKLRGPCLSEIELQIRLDRTDWPAMRNLLLTYWHKFGSKPVCQKDLEPYLRNSSIFSEENKMDFKKELVRQLEKLLLRGTPAEHIQNVVSGLWILYILCGVEGLSDWSAQRLLDVYFQTLQEGLEPTERQPGDDLIVLSGLIVLEQGSLNSSEDQQSWSFKGPRLVQALILLEIGIRHSPCNFTLVMMLARLYNNVGAVVPAHIAFETLEIKHIQVATLSHYAIEFLFEHGAWERLNYVLLGVKSLWKSWMLEGPEGIDNAITQGSFNAAAEFALFQRRLGSSWIFTLSKCMKLELSSLVNVPSSIEGLADVAAEQSNAESWLGHVSRQSSSLVTSNEDHDTLWFWNRESPHHQGEDVVPTDLCSEIQGRLLVQKILGSFIRIDISGIHDNMDELREVNQSLRKWDCHLRKKYRERIGFMLIVFEYFLSFFDGVGDERERLERGSEIRRFIRQEREDLSRCHQVMIHDNLVISPSFFENVTFFTFQTLNWATLVFISTAKHFISERRKFKRKSSKTSGEMVDAEANGSALKAFHLFLTEMVEDTENLMADEKASPLFGPAAVPDVHGLAYGLPGNVDTPGTLPRYVDVVSKHIGDSHHLTLTRASSALMSLGKLLKSVKL